MNLSTKIEQLAAATLSDPRWMAVTTRDRSADGSFVYSVKTTGVYCRPSCASRRARPENVSFHANAAAAEYAGYRACKRCNPNQAVPTDPDVSRITELCRLLERSDQIPTLSELAAHAGLSVFHLHRVFKRITGVTPKAYAAQHRVTHVRSALARSQTVTDAIYAAGYNSSGRFYEQSNHLLGMTPSRYRAGGAKTTIRFALGACSLGSVLVAATERGICVISLGDDSKALVRDLRSTFPHARLEGDDLSFKTIVAKVTRFIDTPSVGLALPLDIRGTAFQRRVWESLQKIRVGDTVTYSELAQRINAPNAVRAVARACAANVLAVAIPCHRVVRKDGSISGYRWGVTRKRALLRREGRR